MALREMSPARTALITVVAVAIVALCAGTFVISRSDTSTTSAPVRVEQFDPTANLAPAADLTAVGKVLSGTGPISITVAGDSSGNAKNEWVYLLANKIAATYGRSIVIHNWEVASGSYVTKALVGAPGRASVTIWNGSAAGKASNYSADNWAKMSPNPADLTIISHGLNERAATVAKGIRGLLYRARTQSPKGVVAVILQPPRLDDRAADHQQLIANMRSAFDDAVTTSGAGLVDVNAAFTNPSTLLGPDLVYPNDAGQRLWADIVAAALGIKPRAA